MRARPRRPSARSTPPRVAAVRTAGGRHPTPRPARAGRRARSAPSPPAPRRCARPRRAGSTCRCPPRPRRRSRGPSRLAPARADRRERRARHRDRAAHRACTDRTPHGCARPPRRRKIVVASTMRAGPRAADHDRHDHARRVRPTATCWDAPQEEYERLRTQARVWEQATGRLLDHVELARGARCLDAGCGSGRDDATARPARRPDRRGRRRRRRRRPRRAGDGHAARRRPSPVLVRDPSTSRATSRSRARRSTSSTRACCSCTCPTRSPCCGACGTAVAPGGHLVVARLRPERRGRAPPTGDDGGVEARRARRVHRRRMRHPHRHTASRCCFARGRARRPRRHRRRRTPRAAGRGRTDARRRPPQPAARRRRPWA